MKDKTDILNPKFINNLSGLSEKDIITLKACLKSLPTLYVDFPYSRSPCSIGMETLLNPIQLINNEKNLT